MISIVFDLYDRLPLPLRRWATNGFIRFRRVRERIGARTISRHRQSTDVPHVVYLSGVSRSGTSLLKAYFGQISGATLADFDPFGFFRSWNAWRPEQGIVFDKSTHYIEIPEIIFKACGRGAAFSNIVRDPRDIMTSLFEWPDSLHIPRDERFWTQWWLARYKGYAAFAQSHGCQGARCHLIRYEDLVRWPVHAKTDFMQWLGLPGSTGVTASYSAVQHDRAIEPNARARSTVVTESIGRWKKASDPKLKALLETCLDGPGVADFMQKLGYGEDGVENRPLAFEGMHVFQPQAE